MGTVREADVFSAPVISRVRSPAPDREGRHPARERGRCGRRSSRTCVYARRPFRRGEVGVHDRRPPRVREDVHLGGARLGLDVSDERVEVVDGGTLLETAVSYSYANRRSCGNPLLEKRIMLVSNCWTEPELPWTKMMGVGSLSSLSRCRARQQASPDGDQPGDNPQALQHLSFLSRGGRPARSNLSTWHGPLPRASQLRCLGATARRWPARGRATVGSYLRAMEPTLWPRASAASPSNYERGRPGDVRPRCRSWPSSASLPGDPVADLAAGTGKLDMGVFAAELDVVGVEPLDEMRRCSRARRGGAGDRRALPSRSRYSDARNAR